MNLDSIRYVHQLTELGSLDEVAFELAKNESELCDAIVKLEQEISTRLLLAKNGTHYPTEDAYRLVSAYASILSAVD